MREIYLDNAATTKILPEVLDAMMPYLTSEYGNPGSIHRAGTDAAKAVEKARMQVASFMGAESPEQIVFTSGGSEGNNLVFYGLISHLKRINRKHIAVSAIEHDSVRKSVLRLFNDYEFDISWIYPKPDGIITLSDVEDSCVIMENTGLVSVMSVNNELGTYNTPCMICKMAHQNGSLFHTDAVQAAGLYPLNADAAGYDFMTISAHKIHGPKGMGALYVRNPELLKPLICGGAAQEFGLRGGTENVAGIVGFGKACELADHDYTSRVVGYDRNAKLLLGTLQKCLEDSGGFYTNTPQLCASKTMSLRFDGVDAESLVLLLSSCGVYVSAGSACRAHESEPSHVLTAIGLTPEQARSSIRISFSELNTEEEAAEAGRIIADCVKTLRGK